MRKSTSDFLCGLAFLAIGLAFYLQTGELEDKSLIFPSALITVVVLGGAWFVGKGLVLRRLEKNAHSHGEPVAWKKVGLVVLTSLIYALLIPVLGFFSATFLFIVGAYLLLGDASRGRGRQLLIGALYGLGFSALIWATFVKLLNVPTPSGLLF